MNEMTKDLGAITAEICMLRDQTASNIIEIGKRLTAAKEMLPHGEWLKWLEEKVQFSIYTASRFMRAAERFANLPTSANLPTGKVMELLALPEGQTDAFVAEHDVESMTVKQLREEIKRAKAETEAEKQRADETAQQAAERVQITKEAFEEKYAREVKAAQEAREAARYQLREKDAELARIKAEIDKARAEGQAGSDARKLKQLNERIDQLCKERDDAEMEAEDAKRAYLAKIAELESRAMYAERKLSEAKAAPPEVIVAPKPERKPDPRNMAVVGQAYLRGMAGHWLFRELYRFGEFHRVTELVDACEDTAHSDDMLAKMLNEYCKQHNGGGSSELFVQFEKAHAKFSTDLYGGHTVTMGFKELKELLYDATIGG
jgi:hypothetical protein